MPGLVVHLARHRQFAGLTQAQLAEAAGVSRKTINTIENRVFVPSTTLALTLAWPAGRLKGPEHAGRVVLAPP